MGEENKSSETRITEYGTTSDAEIHHEAKQKAELIKALEARRDELRADLAWREPDLKSEREELQRLADSEDPQSMINFGAQTVIVRVISQIVADYRAELEAIEEELKELGAG